MKSMRVTTLGAAAVLLLGLSAPVDGQLLDAAAVDLVHGQSRLLDDHGGWLGAGIHGVDEVGLSPLASVRHAAPACVDDTLRDEAVGGMGHAYGTGTGRLAGHDEQQRGQTHRIPPCTS